MNDPNQACAFADRGWDRAGLEVRVGDEPATADVLDYAVAGKVREGHGLNREHGFLVRQAVQDGETTPGAAARTGVS
jgi:hypothetical protein